MLSSSTSSEAGRVPVGGSSDHLISVYPLTDRVVAALEQACGFRGARALVLGELKRSRVRDILRALRAIRCDTLWVVVSEHNYQPYLPLLLLLASLTRAGAIRVTDYAGVARPRNRLGIWVREPSRLLAGSLRGLMTLWRLGRDVAKILRSPRIPIGDVPETPRLAYFKTNLWFGVQAGGSIGHIAGVVNGFARLGSAVEVFTAEQVPMLDAAVDTTYVIGDSVSGLPLEINGYLFHRSFTAQVEKKLRGARPDVIYQRNCLANFSGVAISRALGVPLVIEYNGSEVWVSAHWGTPLRFSRIAAMIEDANLRHAHLVVVVSDVLREELIKRGIAEQRILFYPNCIDPAVFDPARFSSDDQAAVRRRYAIPSDAVVCTFLGTFGPWHGADVLARVIARMATRRLDWLRARRVRFMLVGDGQLMPRVRETLATTPADVVTFTGLVQQHEAPAYLAASDILLSPHVPNPDGSRFFGSPTKLFEYMGMGRAIVASELEQIGAVLDGSWHIGRDGEPADPSALASSTALLATPGSEDELERAILYLVENRGAGCTIGKNARARVLDRYTWEAHVQAILRALRDAPC